MHVNVFAIFILATILPANSEFIGFRSAITTIKPRIISQRWRTLTHDVKVALKGLSKRHQTTQQLKVSDDEAQRFFCTITNPLDGLNSGTSPSNSSPSSTTSLSRSHPSSSSSAPQSSSTSLSSLYNLIESHSGKNFFSGWNFYTDGDPTHGIVQYINQATAQTNNLIEVNDAGNAIMRVETTPNVSSNRMSIRITTQSTWNGGLFVLDAVHMPTGCGTWPAFWTNGPNWPAGGEIDIVEGVNDYTNNQATIHTNPGCSIPSSNSTTLGITGSIVGGTNCASADTGNQGCGVRAVETNSFGAAFNQNGGGMYVMLWDDNGISVYFFPRSSIPSDLSSQSPQPLQWGSPMARWPSSQCDTSKYFYDHSAIFDTTLCGDWAGNVWTSSGIPGQETSCASRTGFSNCEDFVRNNGAAFAQAYWEVKGVYIYQARSGTSN